VTLSRAAVLANLTSLSTAITGADRRPAAGHLDSISSRTMTNFSAVTPWATPTAIQSLSSLEKQTLTTSLKLKSRSDDDTERTITSLSEADPGICKRGDGDAPSPPFPPLLSLLPSFPFPSCPFPFPPFHGSPVLLEVVLYRVNLVNYYW